jgi:ankyrin repeat protein
MVKFMLQMVPETAAINSKKGKLALHFAAGEGHTEVVQALLKVHPEGASLPSGKGKVPIHFAARWDHMRIAKALSRVCPDCVSTLDYEGSLPLHDAAREGQLEMAQFLVERYPHGLSEENIRGETPLFPAVRSGNMDMCVYFIRAWPKGGKHVLQRVREEDNIQNWADGLLDLCLRGGVDNLADCPSKQQDMLESQRPHMLFLSSDTPKSSNGDSANDAASEVSIGSAASLLPTTPVSATPLLDINLPRSKSPILEEGGPRKKRSSSLSGSNKRARRGSIDEDDRLCSCPATTRQRRFLQVHAALECGSSPPVLETVLERHPEQLEEIDDLGKLPLHLAVEHGSNRSLDIIMEKIWKPYKEACSQRDFLGRLPLHLALMSRADCRIVQVLLDSNPASGVEHCDVVDTRFVDKLPIYMATEYQCDLSTVYMLLREDPSMVSSWKRLTTQKL